MKTVVVRLLTAFAVGLVTYLLQAQPYAITTMVGSPGLPGSIDGTNGSARFNAPAGLVLGTSGDLYVADPNAIRRVFASASNWVVTTIAGNAAIHGPQDGTNTEARFDYPQGITVSPSGDLFVADTYNDAIRRIVHSGTNWIVTTIAGVGGRFGFGSSDGTNQQALFHHPYGIAADRAGNLYVADTYNQAIRRITPSGTDWITTTIAGTPPFSGTNDGPGNSASFNNPAAIAVDAHTNLYVADFSNHTIRKLSRLGTNWEVITFAGAPTQSGSVDGLAGAARFNQPLGLVVDAAEHVYVCDFGNNTLRRITVSGSVTTIAGSPLSGGSADGIGSTARFNGPSGIAVDSGGTLYVSDSMNAILRRGIVAPLLQIGRFENEVVLSWPLALTNYVPQRASSAQGAPWNTITTGISSSDEVFVLTNAIEPGSAFFRLQKQ